MWGHYRQFKDVARLSAARRLDLRTLFEAWRHLAAFLKSQKDLRRHCRRQKKQIVADKVHLAEQAMLAGNVRETYTIVRSLAPKDARHRPRLRGQDDTILTRPQEADLMKQHWGKVSGKAWSTSSTLQDQL